MSDPIQFRVSSDPTGETDHVEARLIPSTWDDYAYRTTFDLRLRLPGENEEIKFGSVKILARDYDEEADYRRTVDVIETAFTELDPTKFCSLGQSSNYYARLHQLRAEQSDTLVQELLRALNDVCASQADPWWEDAAGFDTSLLRFRDANIARLQANALLRGEPVDGDTVNSVPLRGLSTMLDIRPSTAEFSFDGNAPIPRRVCVLVGKNGSGKTTLLCDLALHLSRDSSYDKFSYAPKFSRVIFVSFNAFDSANWENRKAWGRGNLRFVGYRGATRDLAKRLATGFDDDEDWSTQLLELFPSAKELEDKLPAYVDASTEALEQLKQESEWQEFCRSAFDDSKLGERLLKRPKVALQEMSAGQQVLTSLYSNLFHHMDRQSLVLLDEPENHLHPSLIARFIRQIGSLLTARRAFALVATHSPIVVQETPARAVWIVQRERRQTRLANPPFETFGESIDNINEFLFETDFRSSSWKAALRGFVESGASREEIENHVGALGLSAYARSFLELLFARRDAD